MMKRYLYVAATVATVTLASCTAQQAEEPDSATGPPLPTVVEAEPERPHIVGQTIYVPVYSHIYTFKNRRSINLAATLSIRNTDAEHVLTLNAVRYYDSHGTLVRDYVDTPLRIGPMASTDFVVDETDTSGGSGANFIVEWSAADPVTEPVVEAIMITTASSQGVSFTSAGRVLSQKNE